MSYIYSGTIDRGFLNQQNVQVVVRSNTKVSYRGASANVSLLNENVSRKTQILISLLLFLSLGMKLGMRMNVMSERYALEQSRSQIFDLEKAERDAYLKYSMATSPANLQLSALRKLEMVPIAPQNMRILN